MLGSRGSRGDLQALHYLGQICRVCRTRKPLDRFPFSPHRVTNGGYDRVCSDCGHAEWVVKQRDRELRTKYGITVAEYDAMLKKQKGACAICKKPPTPKRRLAVDHDHKTGKVRGLLCGRCNMSIGAFEDSIGNIVEAAAYLHRAEQAR